MSATAQHTKITLRGSVEIVTEFFRYAVNNILYQRGLYPPESFKAERAYGMQIMVTSDVELQEYLSSVLRAMPEWLAKGDLEKLVLVVSTIRTNEVMERWSFDIETDENAVQGRAAPSKSQQEIQKEIQAIIRQITASVTFLPLLEEACTFECLVYTRKDAAVPKEWADSDPKFINNSAQVKLRSFTTKVHKLDAMVSYRMDPEDL